MFDRPPNPCKAALWSSFSSTCVTRGTPGRRCVSADAAGADAVVCCGGTVDPYNPKTVAILGRSLFHIPLVVIDDVGDALEALDTFGYRRVGAVARNGGGLRGG